MSYENLNEYYLTKEEVENELAAYNAGRPDDERLFYIHYRRRNKVRKGKSCIYIDIYIV